MVESGEEKALKLHHLHKQINIALNYVLYIQDKGSWREIICKDRQVFFKGEGQLQLAGMSVLILIIIRPLVLGWGVRVKGSSPPLRGIRP